LSGNRFAKSLITAILDFPPITLQSVQRFAFTSTTI